MKSFILPVVLATSLFAVDKPTTPSKPAPKEAPAAIKTETIAAVPDTFKVKLLSLAIQQHDLLADEKDLQNKFAVDVQKLAEVNDRGQKLEGELMTSLGLDHTKYVTQTVDGDVVIKKIGDK